MIRSVASSIALLGAFTLTGCTGGYAPGGAPGGDAGAAPAGDAGLPDVGSSSSSGSSGASCANEGDSCSVTVPCCTVTCPNGVEYTVATCDPTSGLCLPLFLETDAGDPCVSGGSSGGASGGSSGGASGGASSGDGGSPPPGPWVEEVVTGEVSELYSLAAPCAQVLVAAGNGKGHGVVVTRSAGPAPAWTPVAGSEVSEALYGVWANTAGDLLAAGRSDAGTGLLLAGTIDGGLVPVALDGGPATGSLLSVLRLAPGEEVAVGVDPTFTHGVALHVIPDGGVVAEGLPADIARPFRLVGAAGGPVYLLAQGTGGPRLLVRGDGGYEEIAALDGGQLSDLAEGPAGDLVVVGDDGCGNATAYALADGGLAPLPGFPAAAALTAVAEPETGRVLAASILGQAQCDAIAIASCPNPAYCPADPTLLDGLDGYYTPEPLPILTLSIHAIAGGADAGLYAAGAITGEAMGADPLILRRGP